MNPVSVSVVVIGRNEGARLERCLASIERMDSTGFSFDIIYVDSASTDESVALARRRGARVLEVRPSRPTAAIGRNAGWRETRSTFVLFLDGDTILHPEFVREAIAAFRDDTAIVWGHRREIHPERSIYNRVLDLDWIYPPGISEFCGGDALVRRSVLKRVNGFDEGLIAGEEPEMCRRIRALGFDILHIDRPMTGHDLAMVSWKQYWKRATRAGYAYAEVSARFRDTTLPFWLEDAKRNRSRAAMLSAIALFGLMSCAALRSWWPALIALLAYAALAVRTAWKVRWKSSNMLTLLLYGIHSHLQQIPIWWGQWQYIRDQKTGRRRGLIEYKDPA